MVRSTWLAAAVIVGVAGATPAAAQRVWQNDRWVVMPRTSAPMVMRTNPHRWTMRDGRWDAGYRAPGGWNSYRRLHRGGRLPGYWMGGDFRVQDYLSFGLAAPPPGYSWVRYYDDAVLVDRDGSVWDSRDGISWGGAVAMARADDGYARADSRAGAGYPPPRIVQMAPSCAQSCGGWQGGYSGMAWQNGAWVGNYGAGTTVVVIPGAVTTTTTVTEYVTKSYRRAPTKRLWRKTRPRCGC
jgi:Ni/Co efflux regulator RcnB